MDKGIVVAGSLILDTHYGIETYPEEGRLVKIKSIHSDVGGTGNLILDLAKLDSSLPVKVSATLGSGSNGRTVLKTLEPYKNIDVSGINKTGETPVTFVFDAADTMQRTFFYYPAASDTYDEDCIQWDSLDASIFQLEYLLLMKRIDEKDAVYGTHAAKILHEAQSRGMKTSIDMVSEKSERVPFIAKAALKYTDYCTINELEAECAAGIPLVEADGSLHREKTIQALHTLASFGVSTWVIIHSASESYGLDCKSGDCFIVHSLAIPSEIIKGKTGAGDAYCAGVLYSAYNGKNIVEAMQFGNSCSGCSLTQINGTDGLRSAEEVKVFARKYESGVLYEKI